MFCLFFLFFEHLVNSNSDVSYFLFFSGPPVRDTMCNMDIFFENFGVHFYTIKIGTLTPEFDFLNRFPIFSSKKQILGIYVPVLIV